MLRQRSRALLTLAASLAFVTASAALGVPADSEEEVVVRDTVTGATEIASREDGVSGAPMHGRMFDPAISANSSVDIASPETICSG